jgi:hypothetical protein
MPTGSAQPGLYSEPQPGVLGQPVRHDKKATARADAVLGQLDAAIDGLHTETSPARMVRTAIAGSYLDRIGGCREPLWRAVRHGREGGAVTSAIEALFLLATTPISPGDGRTSRC